MCVCHAVHTALINKQKFNLQTRDIIFQIFRLIKFNFNILETGNRFALPTISQFNF